MLTRNNFASKQNSDTNNTTKIHPIQRKCEKKIGSQLKKSRNLKDNNQDLDVKNKSAPLKTSIKPNIVGINNKALEKNIELHNKNKFIASTVNMKPDLTNKSLKKVFNANIDANKKKILPSIETKIKSKDSVKDEKENLPSPVYYSFEEEVCTPMGNLMASKQYCVSASKYKIIQYPE